MWILGLYYPHIWDRNCPYLIVIFKIIKVIFPITLDGIVEKSDWELEVQTGRLHERSAKIIYLMCQPPHLIFWAHKMKTSHTSPGILTTSRKKTPCLTSVTPNELTKNPCFIVKKKAFALFCHKALNKMPPCQACQWIVSKK